MEAGELRLGEQVRRLDGGYGEVRSVHSVRRVQRMYNLTVNEAHTFFVGDGEWLVHNAKKCIAGGRYKDIAANGGEVHHMPAKSVSPLSYGDGPAIWMETADHYKTASRLICGASESTLGILDDCFEVRRRCPPYLDTGGEDEFTRRSAISGLRRFALGYCQV